VTRADDKRLDDILAVADEVASIVSRGKNQFDDDVALRRAVERCLEIIGEAAKSIDDELRAAIADVPWTEVIRLRDRLSHHYHPHRSRPAVGHRRDRCAPDGASDSELAQPTARLASSLTSPLSRPPHPRALDPAPFRRRDQTRHHSERQHRRPAIELPQRADNGISIACRPSAAGHSTATWLLGRTAWAPGQRDGARCTCQVVSSGGV
jgi:uncharacterized protein with HEPN domain